MRSDGKQNQSIEKETNDIFCHIGMYVISFQYIEAKVDQCLMLIWGHENWSNSQRRLASMSNQKKIDTLSDEVHNNKNLKIDRDGPNWNASFDSLIVRLHEERSVRNSLLHSQFIFDFLPLGEPVIQSDRRRGEHDDRFVRHELTKEARAMTMMRMTELLFDVGQMHLQLIRTV